jgi:hypothetical protein
VVVVGEGLGGVAHGVGVGLVELLALGRRGMLVATACALISACSTALARAAWHAP